MGFASLNPSYKLQTKLFGLSDQFDPQVATDRLGGARQRRQGHRFIVGIEKPIKLSAAGVHALGKLGLGESLLPHERVKLVGDHVLDRVCRHLFVDAFFLQEVIEGRSNTALFLFHVTVSLSTQCTKIDTPSQGLISLTRRSAPRRLPEVGDVAGTVAFLLGDGAKNITGTVMTVDAGSTA
jgi:hypothetical protein